MLSERCRPALKPANHTTKEKDSKGVPKLEAEEEEEKKEGWGTVIRMCLY